MSEIEPNGNQSKEIILKDDTDWKLQEEINEEQGNRDIQVTGMQQLTVKKLRAFAKVAEMLKKAGMVEVARGKLLHRQDALEQGRDSLLSIIVDTGKSAEDRVSAAMAMQLLIKAENESAKLSLELDQIAQANSKVINQRQLAPVGASIFITAAAPMKVVEEVKP